MKTTNKIKLVNLSTWIMVITISITAIFFIGFVIANTFDLNVFTRRTSSFISSFIGFTAVIVICSAILNISLNISLIADSKLQESKNTEKAIITAKFYWYVLGLILFMIGFLFTGDYLTRKNEKERLIAEANDIITRYKTSIDKIPTSLADTAKIKQVLDILDFLSNQKQEFPSVSLITSDKFNGQLTFLEISENSDPISLKKPFFDNSFYKCEAHDCEYLENFFTGKTNESHFWTEENEYMLYFPFSKDDKKYILLFTKYQRYGKVGS